MTQSNLAEQGEAISLYLDSLLKEGPEDEAAASTAEAEPTAAPQVMEPEEMATEPAPEPAPVVESTPAPVAAPQGLQLPEQPDALIPAWANAPFQAILFKVGELSLALPLTELTGVVEWSEISQTNNTGGVHLGTCQYADQTVPVVDTARLVLPATMLEDLAGGNPAERVTKVVVIEQGRLGLACDAVHEIITLQPAQIRWHTARTRRQWLAGTSVELMCALLDTGGLVKLLSDAI